MKRLSEKIARFIFIICAVVAVVSVVAITIYMIMKGAPALFKVGALDLIFGTNWQPTAQEPSYGIGFIILSSIVGTFLAVLLGVPIALLTAAYLTEIAHKKVALVISNAVELLAAIPSVIYGLLGLMILNPFMYKLEKIIFANSSTVQIGLSSQSTIIASSH